MSIVHEIVDRINTRMADTSILFLAGKRRLNQNAQKRRVVFTRAKGVLTPSVAPDGVKVTALGKTRVLFRRSEMFLITLSAADESDLDELFDRFVCATWNEFAPNVFLEPTEYEWDKSDSQDGGSHIASNPKIVIGLTFRFQVTDQPRTVTVIDSATATADLE